jgi:hypothetical protein
MKKIPVMSRVFYYEILKIDLEPWRLPLEKGDVRFLYTDVEFY